MRALFEIGKSGLYAAERSLSVTANNITNADTPGYSRQRVDKIAVGQQMPGYFAGLGVNVVGIERLRDEMTDRQLINKRQEMGFMQEKIRIYEMLESSLASDTGNDLDMRIGSFFDSFSELSNDPQDHSVRFNLVTDAAMLTEKLGDMSMNLDRIKDLTRDSTTTIVNQVNDLIRDISALNKSITTSKAMERPDNASLDLQVKKIEELSQLVDIDTLVTDNGATEITINGIQVIYGDRYRELIPEVNESLGTYDVYLTNGIQVEPKGGKLAASIDLYEKDIPEIKRRLDSIAEVIVTEVNALHSEGYGLEDDVQRDFFDPAYTTAATIRINNDILDNQLHIAASSEPGEAGNAGNAMRLANLRDQQIVEGRRMIDYAVGIISEPGSKLTELRSVAETRDSEIRMLTIHQERETGVNIDEELSLLIQYQNAYQGAARVMASAQQMYDTLLSLVR